MKKISGQSVSVSGGSVAVTSSVLPTGAATSSNQDLLKQPTRMATVTKSDSTDITSTATKGLYVGGAGDLAVMGVGDSAAVTLVGVPAGTFVPGAYKRVMSTNTTATNIISFYGP